MQPRTLQPERLSFRIEGEIKSFQDKQKLKEFVNTKPALEDLLKGHFEGERDQKPKGLERNRQSTEK